MKLINLIIFFVLVVFFGSVSVPYEVEAKELKYKGVKSCKKCHKKKKEGKQYQKWQKAKHSKAFKTLNTSEALKMAKELGITEKPSESPACLICHTTAYGKDKKLFAKKFKFKDGVQCEACHGPGQKYGKKKEKKKLVKLKRALSKATEGSGDYQKISSDLATERIRLGKIGLIMASEKYCKTCHVPERKFQGNYIRAQPGTNISLSMRNSGRKYPIHALYIESEFLISYQFSYLC